MAIVVGSVAVHMMRLRSSCHRRSLSEEPCVEDHTGDNLRGHGQLTRLPGLEHSVVSAVVVVLCEVDKPRQSTICLGKEASCETVVAGFVVDLAKVVGKAKEESLMTEQPSSAVIIQIGLFHKMQSHTVEPHGLVHEGTPTIVVIVKSTLVRKDPFVVGQTEIVQENGADGADSRR